MAMDPVKGVVTEPVTMVQYVYCRNNPVVMIDPLGLWSREVHYGDTKRWAEIFFNKNDAKKIATANKSIDGGETTPITRDPQSLGWHFDMSYWLGTKTDTRDGHFEWEYWRAVTELVNSRLNEKQSKESNLDMRNTYKKWADISYDKALEHLGRALHPLQDKYAHGKWRPLEKGNILASPHTAYLQKFYDDGREFRYLHELDKDNPIMGYFDNIAYDLTYEEREFLYKTFYDTRYLTKKWVYVARFVSFEGGTRYEGTETATKRALFDFYLETKK